ncbi:hypothetical protein RJT34_10469 [Clitoria ternatea]|uniref:Uncharacterized protein n=1 Tax=Clitoria ternatea TaxID=43366 RepID=A0AAN9K640_CLITE
MGHTKHSEFTQKRLFSWIIKVGFLGLALFGTVTSEDKVETPPSDLLCISDCATCPVICSPPPPMLVATSSHPPPPSPSPPHSPPPSYVTFSPPPPKSQSPPSHSSGAAPPPPFKPFNTAPSGSSQPQPTVIAGPHDFSYPYYYFYASPASSLSVHAPFFVVFLFFILHNWVLYCW